MMDAEERMEYIDRACRHAFIVGWLKQTLVGMGMSQDAAQQQVDRAGIEWDRLFKKEASHGN